MVSTSLYLILSGLIFTIGAVGVLTRRSALIILMCVELMLNSVNLTLIALSRQWDNLNGQIFVFMIMAVAAAEVAVGLGDHHRPHAPHQHDQHRRSQTTQVVARLHDSPARHVARVLPVIT